MTQLNSGLLLVMPGIVVFPYEFNELLIGWQKLKRWKVYPFIARGNRHVDLVQENPAAKIN